MLTRRVMTPQLTAFVVFLASLFVVLIFGRAQFALSAGPHSISVSLFGQTCQLRGPFDVPTLKAIHSISPEQMPRPRTIKEAQLQQKRVRSFRKPPLILQRYLQQLDKQLGFTQELFGAYEEARANRKADQLLALGKDYLPAKKLLELQAWSKKLESKGPVPPLTTDTLTEWFEGSLGPNTEEEFHRMIRALKVNYSCSFDDSDAETENSTEEE
jgi:hypothetical protein